MFPASPSGNPWAAGLLWMFHNGILPMKAAITAAALLLLAACGPRTAGEATADNLHDAADQSGPAAARVPENAADSVIEVSEPDQANAMADQALNDAGNAQTAPPPQPR